VRLVPVYRPRASALHSARAGVAASFCCALALAGALYQHPLILAAVLAGIALAAAGAGAGREVARSARVALPFALLVALVNPLVYQEGDTLLVRGGEVLGRRFDITLEATVAGALAGLRIVAIIVALWLMSVAVDPDALLRLFRRVSYRSALSASLATRLVPVLASDAARMGDAARCRPQPPGRLAVTRSALAGALERSVDLAAALELRGYSLAGRPARRRSPWSRHDLRLAAAAAGIALVAIAGRAAGIASVDFYPRLEVELGAPEVVLALSVVALAALPFAGRGARMGVGRG
jgi:energy-coupling factor transport system permease protein